MIEFLIATVLLQVGPFRPPDPGNPASPVGVTCPANQILAGPVSGPPSKVACRLMVVADLPGPGLADGTWCFNVQNQKVTGAVTCQ